MPNQVVLLMGTTKGAFFFHSDEGRREWRMTGPHLSGWEVYSLHGDGRHPDRVYAGTSHWVYGTTVRVTFKIPGNTFSIQEAVGGVLLASRKDKENNRALNDSGKVVDAVDPWAAAEARIKNPDKPSVGASPFASLTNAEGDDMKRYNNISLGSGVQFLKLIVAHEPEPRTSGEASVHFFPGGRSENALIQLGDGRDGVYTVEVRALTGRVKVYGEAYESNGLLGDPEDREGDVGEVKTP